MSDIDTQDTIEEDASASTSLGAKLFSYLLVIALLSGLALGYYYVRFFLQGGTQARHSVAAAKLSNAGSTESIVAPSAVPEAAPPPQEMLIVTEEPVTMGPAPDIMPTEPAASTSADDTHKFKQLSALWTLKEKIDAGEEYRYELVAFKKLLRPVDEEKHSALWDATALLDAASREGYVSPTVLREQLQEFSPSLATHYRVTHQQEKRWLWRMLARWVRVMPVDAGHATNDVELLLLKCDTALEQGETVVARNYANQLEGIVADVSEEAREPFMQWLKHLRQRVEADEVLDRLFALMQETR